MKNLKEMRVALFGLYETAKEILATGQKLEPIPFEKFKAVFADELFAEARAALKANEANAAGGNLVLSGVQALAMKSRGKLMDRINLTFRESPEQVLKSMAGFEAVDARLDVVQPKDGGENMLRIALLRTDGIEESTVYAEIPVIEVGDVLFVLEPFTSEDKTGKVWSDMSVEERASFSASGAIRQASAMPKYLMRRRAIVDAVTVRFDNRTAWLEVVYKEAEPFERTREEELALIAEFHPTSAAIGEAASEEAAQEAKDGAKDGDDTDPLLLEAQAVNAGEIDHEDLHDIGELGASENEPEVDDPELPE